MDMSYHLPFEVGQQAESKSFIAGYRGAWFRCKIKDISSRKGQIGHVLEFFDFPDEKVKWTKLYQKSPTDRNNPQEDKMQLMVRPCFPRIYYENQMPDVRSISEVVAVVDNVWKLGDLVDWWTDGCHWSGVVTHLLGEDKVQIKLLEPPLGEGNSYEVFCEDLRPSLDWSPRHGWTVPISMDNGTSRYCARLIPVPQDDGRKDDQATDKTSASISSHGTAGSLPSPDRSEHPPATEVPKQLSCSELNEEEPPVMEMLKKFSCGELNKEETPAMEMTKQLSCGELNKEEPHALHTDDLNLDDNDLGKASFSESISSSHDKDTSAATARTTSRKDRYGHSGSSKKMRISGSQILNSMCSDTIESSILDLEELANRIKWLKGVLQMGLPDGKKPSWKFLEHRASFT